MMNSRPAYVANGVGVNLLMLARGVALMIVLGYADLGLVALVQTAILFSGMLHFGLLNGGYRLLCHAGPRYKQRIIDLAYTGFGAIASIIILAALILATFWLDSDAHRLITGLTALGGICSLLRAWMTNEMVAAGRLKAVNLINATSMLASLGVVGMLFVDGINLAPAVIAVAAIAIQPVLFAALSLISGAVLRPTRFYASKRLGGAIFTTGFTLFLTGIAIQFNSLIERSYVSDELGLEALGRLYLAFLFLTLFQMTPNLIQQVFLPQIVTHWKAREAAKVGEQMRNLLAIIALYCVATALALWLLAEPLLGLVLPAYVDDLRWVYLLAPGLIIFALSAPFALSFNVAIDYTWYLIAYGAGIVATLAAFGGAIVTQQSFSLDGVIILRSGIYMGMAGLLMIGWRRLARRQPAFHLTARSLAEPSATV